MPRKPAKKPPKPSPAPVSEVPKGPGTGAGDLVNRDVPFRPLSEVRAEAERWSAENMERAAERAKRMIDNERMAGALNAEDLGRSLQIEAGRLSRALNSLDQPVVSATAREVLYLVGGLGLAGLIPGWQSEASGD